MRRRSACERDRRRIAARGLAPFLVVGTAGTVNTGRSTTWPRWPRSVQARAACGFTSTVRSARCARWRRRCGRCIAGIERADSVAFDFHKWAHVPYDAGFVLVRDADMHRRTFSNPGRLSQSRAAAALRPAKCGRAISVPISRAGSGR